MYSAKQSPPKMLNTTHSAIYKFYHMFKKHKLFLGFPSPVTNIHFTVLAIFLDTLVKPEARWIPPSTQRWSTCPAGPPTSSGHWDLC